MKNAINYFYNLYPNDIRQNKEEYFFELNNKKYLLEECNRSNEEIYELYDMIYFMHQKNIYIHQIVLNNNGEFITIINNKRYILMNMFVDNNKKIELDDINKLTSIKVLGNYTYIKRNDWRNLWSKKIDYIEYQIEENKNKYREFSLNIDYFIGLAENAIQLLEEVKANDLYINHLRINSNMRIKDLYNPLNIILDSKVRDSCEYFKDIFLKKKSIIDEIFKYFNNNNLYIEEITLFFIRFLYVTRYFDLFDNILLEKDNVKTKDEIKIIVNEIEKYEYILKKIYLYLYQNSILPEIEWLKKTSI